MTHTCSHWHALTCTDMCWHVLTCAGTYQSTEQHVTAARCCCCCQWHGGSALVMSQCDQILVTLWHYECEEGPAQTAGHMIHHSDLKLWKELSTERCVVQSSLKERSLLRDTKLCNLTSSKQNGNLSQLVFWKLRWYRAIIPPLLNIKSKMHLFY